MLFELIDRNDNFPVEL